MNQASTNTAKAERNRIAAIVALPEAKGNEQRARHLALTTDMTVDQVKATLAAETSTLWDAALAGRGLKIGAKGSGDASGPTWDAVLRAKGLVGA